MAGHARGRGDHVLLRDPALEEPLRVGELEGADAAVGGEVGVEDDEVVALCGELEQRLAVRLDDVLPSAGHSRPARAGARLRLALEAADARLRLGGLERGRLEAERRAPLGETGLELGDGERERLVAGRARVPAIGPAAVGERDRMLHERDALALDRPGDERLRRVAPGAEAREGGAQRDVVVPVDRLDVPAERAELRLEVAERDDLLRPLVGLHLVAVDDDPEPAEPLVGGRLERLPVLALLELAVAGHHDHPSFAAEPPLRERDPAALGDAHPERARARLDPGNADVRVPVEPAEAAEPQQPLPRDDAERVERRVEAGHVVALGREEDVAVRIVEAALGDVQLVEQEVGDDVERAERRAEVPRPGALHGDEGVQPARVGEQRELRVGIDVGRAQAIEFGLGDEEQIRHVRHETVADVLALLSGRAARTGRPSRAGRTPGREGPSTPRPRTPRATWRSMTRSAETASTAGTTMRRGRRHSAAHDPERAAT